MAGMSGLRGKRVVVTRARAQASALADRLAARGAIPILFPTIEIAPLDDGGALERALRSIQSYHWVAFTSANAVATVFERWPGQAFDLGPCRAVAVGPATAGALAKHGLPVEYVPEEYVATAIVDGLGDVAGKWVLLPRAEAAREGLADELGRRGAVVHEIAVYRTLPAEPDLAGLAEMRRGVDAIIFTSGSTVRNFLTLLGQSGGDEGSPAARPWIQDGGGDWPVIACIGPVTADAARDHGLPVHVVPASYTTEGLVQALEQHFA